jgi:hypothetical protein
MMALLRGCFCFLVAMPLAACGARDGLGVASNGPAGSSGRVQTGGSTSSSAASSTSSSGGLLHHLAWMRADCGPADGVGVGFHIDDTTGCDAGTNAGIYVFVGGMIQTAVPLSVSSDPNAPVQAQRIMAGAGPSAAVGVSGTITFTTFVMGASATGSYDITFSDATTEQGDFTASFCPGIATCG